MKFGGKEISHTTYVVYVDRHSEFRYFNKRNIKNVVSLQYTVCSMALYQYSLYLLITQLLKLELIHCRVKYRHRNNGNNE